MSDLVQQLHNIRESKRDEPYKSLQDLCNEAAERIEALQTELDNELEAFARYEVEHKGDIKTLVARIEALEAALRIFLNRDVITNSPSLGANVIGYDPPLTLDELQTARRALEGKHE